MLTQRWLALSFFGLLLFVLFGCGQSGAQEFGFADYWYVLPTPKSKFERVGDHGLVWESNGWELLVDENEAIFFNNQPYGKMDQGDELIVTWEGRLFLNKVELVMIKPS